MNENQKDTVLIVDDTRSICILVNAALKNTFNTQIANDGEEALKIAFSDNPPDLILLDVMMPKMDGYEVCARLKADQRTKHIPVIFVTAKTQFADIKKGFEVGGIDYIMKPINLPDLMTRVTARLNLENAMKANQDLRNKLNK
ncbi:two-component system response regulator [candidate division CSSED10-310 bacterium]|uniref:Two-component system response regulator n=1 Tax=candidate division CSSED10-310 bacterium TaxID=2855610 RepID=A0ABV6YS84_UNCC1